MGKHYLLNLYGCEFDYLNNETYLRELLEIAAEASGATVIQTISKKFEPHGVTAVCLLSESHISIHSWLKKEKQQWIYLHVVTQNLRWVAILSFIS